MPKPRTQTAQNVIGWLASGEVELPVEATYGLDENNKSCRNTPTRRGRWGKILVKP